MQTHILKHNNENYALRIKKMNIDENDFSITTSGNNVTVTSYIGNKTDVTVMENVDDMYFLVIPDNQ